MIKNHSDAVESEDGEKNVTDIRGGGKKGDEGSENETRINQQQSSNVVYIIGVCAHELIVLRSF